MLMLLASISVMILLYSYSGAVLVLFTGIFVGALTLICSILMVEFISKVPFDVFFNN